MTVNQNSSMVNLNVGGDGESRQFVECPPAKGLYKVVARAGDADRQRQGYCRTFIELRRSTSRLHIFRSAVAELVFNSPRRRSTCAPRTRSPSRFSLRRRRRIVLGRDGRRRRTALRRCSANPRRVPARPRQSVGQVVVTKTFQEPRSTHIQSVSTRFECRWSWSSEGDQPQEADRRSSILGFSTYDP